MTIEWQWKPFNELSLMQLYQLLQLRQAVFCVEQDCVYQDVDGIDPESDHLLGYENERLVACARVFEKNGEAVLGRIVSAKSHRGQGLGKLIMTLGLQYIAKSHYPKRVYLMAQLYLEAFYQAFGFQTDSAPYDEDGILHIDMRLDLNAL